MKNNIYLSLSLGLIILSLNAAAQDYIYQTDKTQIKCQVVAVEVNDVIYKKWDNLNGPTYTIFKTDILMIQYANGSSDFFNVPPVQQQQQSQQPTQQQQQTTYTPPVYVPPAQSIKPPHDFLSSFTETDYSSYLGVGLMYTRFVPGNFAGFYAQMQGNFAINGGVTDADSSSSLIFYFGGGVVLGYINDDGSSGILANGGLDYEAITGNLMYNAKIYTFYNDWMFGFKWFGFISNGGGPYIGMFVGYQFKL